MAITDAARQSLLRSLLSPEEMLEEAKICARDRERLEAAAPLCRCGARATVSANNERYECTCRRSWPVEDRR